MRMARLSRKKKHAHVFTFAETNTTQSRASISYSMWQVFRKEKRKELLTCVYSRVQCNYKNPWPAYDEWTVSTIFDDGTCVPLSVAIARHYFLLCAALLLYRHRPRQCSSNSNNSSSSSSEKRHHHHHHQPTTPDAKTTRTPRVSYQKHGHINQISAKPTYKSFGRRYPVLCSVQKLFV